MQTNSTTSTMLPAWRAEYDFDDHVVTVNGQQMHYVDEGNGSPVLMVHGNPTWSFYWRKLVYHLRDRWRCVAPDHIGCGLSDKPSADQYPYTLARRVDDLTNFIERLDLQDVTLVVHDWGGPIGLGAAAGCPERIAGLVLLNTGAFPPHYFPWRLRLCRTPILGKAALQGLNLFSRAAMKMAVHDIDALTPVARAGLLAPYDNWSNREAVYRFVKDIPATAAHPTWQTLGKLESQLPRLAHLPCLIIWGMKDWCFDERSLRRLQTLFPTANVHELENVGHWVMEESPTTVKQLVGDFLADRLGHHA